LYSLPILFHKYLVLILFQSWVSHFDRKYQYEKFKVRLKNEGFQKLDEEGLKSSAKSWHGLWESSALAWGHAERSVIAREKTASPTLEEHGQNILD
jgi:hypothetical protein